MNFKTLALLLIGFLIEVTGIFVSVGGFIILAQTGMTKYLFIGPVMAIIGASLMLVGIYQLIPDELKDDIKNTFKGD